MSEKYQEFLNAIRCQIFLTIFSYRQAGFEPASQEKYIVGGNCTSVSVSGVKLWGDDLNEYGTCIVTVNIFLADGGDNFTTLSTVDSIRLDRLAKD